MISYLVKNWCLKRISFLRILQKKFNGTISIPPKLLLVVKICIKHLYKSLQLYLSNKVLLVVLFRAKYGGLVITYLLLKSGGSSNVSLFWI